MINRKELKQMVKNILPSSVYRELLKLRYFLLSVTGRMKIEVLVVSVGQACNLRCRDCGTLAPFSPKEFRRYRFEDIVDSLDIIFKRIHQVNCIQIQGGEPFLYSDLDKLIKYLGNKMNLGGGTARCADCDKRKHYAVS